MISKIPVLNRYDISIIIGLTATFLGICSQYYWYVMDDAFITLRYSKHLADGSGLLWNVGTDPVEGYTSFLWVLLGAIPHMLNIDAVGFVKIVGILSTVLTFLILYVYSRYRNSRWWLALIGASQLALSPAIAVLSVQGMETVTAMFLILIASISAVEYTRTGDTRFVIVLNGTLLLCMLARPDSVVFAVLVEVGLVGVLYRRGRISEMKKFVSLGSLFMFFPGILYMIARYWYFGYLLPNTFYIKSEVGARGFGVIPRGLENTETFLITIMGAALLLAIISWISGKRSTNRLISIFPIVLGVAGFLSLYLFFEPLQGYLWRFQMPIFGAGILAIVLFIDETLSEDLNAPLRSMPNPQMILSVLLVCALVLTPVATASAAYEQTTIRTPGDRIVMGQALGDIHQDDYKMFVTESGAIPYYSDWTAIDWMGLNNEHIAHEGRSEQFLQNYDPDLVQVLVSGRPGMIQDRRPATAALLESNSYVLVAAVHKQNRDKTNIQTNRYHLYFVDKHSDGYREISCTILTQDLQYGNRSKISSHARFDIQISSLNKSDCQ